MGMMPTRGPWVASNQHAGTGWRVESDAPDYPNDGWIICGDMLGPDAEANAHLVAAAPDLLSVAIDMFENPQFQVAIGGNPIMVDALMERARAAIFKAGVKPHG